MKTDNVIREKQHPPVIGKRKKKMKLEPRATIQGGACDKLGTFLTFHLLYFSSFKAVCNAAQSKASTGPWN